MIYYSDGYCLERNPSPYGGGYTICDVNGDIIETQRIEKKGLTNNEAELLGAVRAIELAQPNDTVVVDSMNTISWILRGIRKEKRIDLKPIAAKAYEMLIVKEIYLAWQPREVNKAGWYNEKYFGS